MGWVPDRCWAGTYANGVRIYDFDAYPAGFALVLVWRAAARILLVFVRGTHCRQTQQPSSD